MLCFNSLAFGYPCVKISGIIYLQKIASVNGLTEEPILQEVYRILINKLHFQSVKKLLEDEGLNFPAFQCINSDPATFRLLKMQPRADFRYDKKQGPHCTDAGLIRKCRDALQCAKDEYADLVLFPEYSMPYSLLREIISDTARWPDENKLWCLPCQAISHKDFFIFLEEAKEQEQILVLDKKCCEDPNLQSRFFVNALFYCFIVKQNGVKKLVLLPQLKMHPMSDPAYLCESSGLTTGGLIYYFKGEDICLLSIICADIYHNDLSWKWLVKQTGSQSLIILHPQLNSNPRESSFSRLRREMMEQNNPSLYISCNWAAATTLGALDGSGATLKIDLSWSCIYHKYELQIPVKQLYQNCETAQTSNLKWGLCAGVIERCRTVVWFTDSSEAMYIVQLAAAHASGYAVVNRHQGCCAESRYIVTDDAESEPCWISQEYDFTLWDKLQSIQELSYLSHRIFCGPASQCLNAREFPFHSDCKDKVDSFFSLACALGRHPLALSETNEIPVAWTLFLDDNDIANANTSLNRFLKLCVCLYKNLPPHLKELQNQLQFVYLPPEQGAPPSNLQSTNLEQRRMLVAFADDEYKANRYLQYLEKKVLGDNEPDGRYICVFYQDPLDSAMTSLPRSETRITCGDAFQSNSSITNGGPD